MSDDEIPTIADLINRLFQAHLHPEENREYLGIEVAIATNAAIQQGHLRGLRSGKIKNPTRETLLALCEFFQVEPRYFFPELKGKDLKPE